VRVLENWCEFCPLRSYYWRQPC